MRFTGSRRAAISAAFVTSTVLLFSASALANESLEVQKDQTVVLGGTVRFKSITVRSGGKIKVRPVTDGVPGSGSLTLKAGSITVEAGGVIDASGAGFAGTATDGASAACGANAGGAAGPSGAGPSPGGGGSSAGKGAAGCPTGGDGGTPYIQSCEANPGAAGGAAFIPNAPADAPIHGGAGGGAITLLAAVVHVEGSILADGAAGFVYSGVGTGGGAGGYISIDAATVDGAGLISAKGGDGGDGLNGRGGAGGGGTIRVSAATAPEPKLDTAGGKTGTCPGAQAGIADPQVVADKCVDVDGDGEKSSACGGDDCDDSDPTVKGGSKPALEVCDGQDNDCNDAIDDELVKDACGDGQSCTDGICVDDGGGGSGGGTTTSGSPPDYVEYRGACDFGRAAHRDGLAFYGAALVAFLAGLRLQRKRRR